MQPRAAGTVSALCALAASLVLAVPRPLPAAQLSGWIGTYTVNQGKNSGSGGIYAFQWDSATGSLQGVHAVAPMANPSFLTLHPNGRYLYAVSEGGGSATADRLNAFAIDGAAASGGLKPLGSVSSMGKGPCYVSVDPSGRWLFTANYQSGTIAVFAIGPDGRLAEAAQTIQQQGTGPVAGRQNGPHAHEVVLSPDGQFLLAADLGADRVFVYRFDAATGTLRANDPAAAVLPAGYGPRHLVFSHDARLLYVITELADRLVTLRWDARTGTLTPLAESSALPADFTGERSGAEIALHPNGKFLYTSNRGDSNTIAIFRIGPDGIPVPAGHVASGGKTPRYIGIDPSGHYLIAMNQDSSNVVIFRIDAATGGLDRQGEALALPAPVDMVFARPRAH
jgi:6-phosphogluconolactonase